MAHFLCVSNVNSAPPTQCGASRIFGVHSKKKKTSAIVRIALEMRQYLTDCALMPHLPVLFRRNESNKRKQKWKNTYTYIFSSYFSSVASNPFIIFALFQQQQKNRRRKKSISAYRFGVFGKMLIPFHSLAGVELSSIENSWFLTKSISVDDAIIHGDRLSSTSQFNLWPVRNAKHVCLCINWFTTRTELLIVIMINADMFKTYSPVVQFTVDSIDGLTFISFLVNLLDWITIWCVLRKKICVMKCLKRLAISIKSTKHYDPVAKMV